jgi:hypothetical protein
MLDFGDTSARAEWTCAIPLAGRRVGESPHLGASEWPSSSEGSCPKISMEDISNKPAAWTPAGVADLPGDGRAPTKIPNGTPRRPCVSSEGEKT